MALPKAKTKKEQNYLKLTYLFYGQPKAGKTTIASQLGGAEGDVLFFPTEPGHKLQEIYAYQVNDAGDYPTKWEHFLECARELSSNDHNFKALCVDTIDNLWNWCTDYVNKKNDLSHESDLGFGKGYKFIVQEFSKVINYLGQKNLGLIFLSHEKSEERTTKHGIKTTYVDATMANSCRKYVNGLVDFIFYFKIDSDNKRWIITKATEYMNAGDRSGVMPESIEMSSEVLIAEIKKALSGVSVNKG